MPLHPLNPTFGGVLNPLEGDKTPACTRKLCPGGRSLTFPGKCVISKFSFLWPVNRSALGNTGVFLLLHFFKGHSFMFIRKLLYLLLLVWLPVSAFAMFETESFSGGKDKENIGAQSQQELQKKTFNFVEVLNTLEDPTKEIRTQEILSEVIKMQERSPSLKKKEEESITTDDVLDNPDAFSVGQIENVLIEKSKKRDYFRSLVDEYLKVQSFVTSSTNPKALEFLEKRREELVANGIDPEYEKYRKQIERNDEAIYAVTQYINPKTGLFGVVPSQDITNEKLGKILSVEQLKNFNSAPQSIKEREVFNLIVQNHFPEGGVDTNVALEILKKHYQTDSKHGVVSKYAQELQRKKDEETAYTEAGNRIIPALIEHGGDLQSAINSLDGNLNLYAQNIFNQEPALKYIYQRAYNSVSWIKDEYIASGELDWNKMADRLIALGDGETFQVAIQMLPYILPKDNRTWLVQALDDTYTDVVSFARLLVSGGADNEKAERLVLSIQQEYRAGRDMPSSWIGRATKSVVDNVVKIFAVTTSGLVASAISSETGPGAPIIGLSTAMAVGSMVYGAPAGLEAYRTNSSRPGALAYGITVFIGFGVASVVGIIIIVTLLLAVRLIHSMRRGWSFTCWACFLTVFLLGVAVMGGDYDFFWKNYSLPYGYYTLLRLSVAGLSAWLVYCATIRQSHPLLILLPVLLSILYQPLVKITFEKETWLWVNLATMPLLVFLTAVADRPEGKESPSEQTDAKKELSTETPLFVDQKETPQLLEAGRKRKSFLWSWLFGFTLAVINILFASLLNIWLNPSWGIYLLNPGGALFFFITGWMLKKYLEKDPVYWKYGVRSLKIFLVGLSLFVLVGG